MNPPSNEIRDSDLRQVETALRRAAAAAREVGRRNNTPVYILRDGKIVNLTAEAKSLQETAASNSAA